MLPDNIVLSTNLSEDLAHFLQHRNYSKCAVLADENTLKWCYPIIHSSIGDHFVIEVKSGEEHKNLDTCRYIWEKLTDANLDRHAVLIVLGGGVLGDMGGFCAATFKRGIDFILIPTTLLAQVDASIGGKLGIDFNHFKNHIGVFQTPALTILSSGFLRTLPAEELRSGFAEVIKHCLISDRAMWNTIRTKKINDQDWNTLVRHSVVFKAGVTTEDPKEKGLRKILNAGHTIGHAVESFLLGTNKRILHGEAIAIGIIAEGFIAAERGLLQAEELDEIADYVMDCFGKVELSEEAIEQSALLTVQDKKNKGSKILCVLLDGIGKAQWDMEISVNDAKRALVYYQSR